MTKAKWRLLDTGPASGSWNMALDEALMIHHGRGETPPTLRFYAWDPPAVSIGYFQSMHQEIDTLACANRGISTVRRLTGGRAILHDREVTYSVIAKPDNPLVSGTVLESYLKISRCLLEGLHEMGIDARLFSADAQKKKSAACFDTPSRYELVVNGRKLVGSAQARMHDCILQHGSIPIDIDLDSLFSVLKFAGNKERVHYRQEFFNRAISLNDAGKKSYTYSEVVQSVTRGFERVFNIELENGFLTPREKETATELYKLKYNNDEWNYKK